MAGRTYTVLLADDVAALRKLVRLGIESGGRFRVVGEAGTGSEAIEMARQIHPDLVLLDLSMPEMDGLEALPRVLEAAPHTHVVVLSGFNHVRMAPVATRLGASAYLEKGLEPARLNEALLAVLEPSDAPAERPPSPGHEAIIPNIVESLAPPQDPEGPSSPAQADALQDQQPPSRGTADRPSSWQVRPTFRVLLVEPDTARATALSSLLRPAFDAVAVPDVAQAIAALDARQADLALVDPAASASARQTEDDLIEILTHAATVPVVVLAGPGSADLQAAALRLGIEDCLPFEEIDRDRLVRSVRYAIARRRALEARLQVRRREEEISQLREVEQVKTQFFNTAAHELGTPLTPIRIQVALLKGLVGANGDDAGRKSLEILERNVRRLSHLNQDILDVARLQAHHLSVHPRPTDLRTALQDVVDTFEGTAKDAGIRLAMRCPPGLAAQADPERLSQILFNLVSNALKFTPRGGSVLLDGQPDATECHVAVRDTGVGLTPDQIAGLFKPFSQVLGIDQPHGVGTGLGLFISRGIAELHGGRLVCESPGHGKGTTFTLSLPRPQTVVDPRGARLPFADGQPQAR